jgi:5-methylthioadenosine/S-adenosylhomocysteine deaminase
MKEQADTLIVNGYILAMDDKGTLLDHGGVAIKGERIIDLGPSSRIESMYKAEKIIDPTRMAIMPGLVDTYGHAGHGMIGGWHTPIDGWPAGELYWHATTPEWWYAEAQLAATERLRFGTTTGASIIGSTPARTDNPIFAYKNAEAYTKVGIRGVFGVGPPDVFVSHIASPWSGSYLENGEWVTRNFTYEEALKNSVKIIEKWHNGSNRRIKIALAPPYLFGRQASHRRYGYEYKQEDIPVMLEKAREMRTLADEHEVQIHTHFFRGSVDFALEHFGREKVDELIGPDVVIAHGNGLQPTEVQVIGENRCSVATAPSTAEDIWYGYAPVIELLKAGANVTISTDGSAPRFSFDLWKDIVKEMWHQWIKHNDQKLIPVGKALRMVTIDAAKALQMDSEIGSLETGKKADIILVDLDRPHLTPQTFIPNQLAYYVNGNDVDTVMVDGRILMEKKQIKSVNVNDVMKTAREEMEKAAERVDLKPFTEVDRNFWHGITW